MAIHCASVGSRLTRSVGWGGAIRSPLRTLLLSCPNMLMGCFRRVINGSAEKFCLDNLMGKSERAKRAPPHPSGRDKSGPYNTRNKLPHSMQEMQRIGKSYGPSFFWVVVNCPPYTKRMICLIFITIYINFLWQF